MNIMRLSACTKGMGALDQISANKALLTQAKLLGLDVYPTEGTYGGVAELSVLVMFKTDHEKALGHKLAHSHKQEAVYVVENITLRHGELLGTGGLEYSTPDYPYYQGQHDDITVSVLAGPPKGGDYTALPAELGNTFIQCK